jgi:hypothetical protein
MLEPLLQLLRGEDVSERMAAAEGLRALSHPGKLERIGEVARDPKASELGRRDAIALIAESNDGNASALLRGLAVEPSVPADARTRALAALARRDPAALAQVADALLRDPDPAVRAALVCDAGRLAREHAERIVRAALDDPASAVRSAVHFPITELGLVTLAAPLAAAFAKIDERIRREKGSVADWDRAWEEDALLRALAKCAAHPDARGAVAPIAGALVELAADPYAYDAQQGLLAGANAADVLAVTGVPQEHVDALAAIVENGAVEARVRESALEALGSSGKAAVGALRVKLARAVCGMSRLSPGAVKAALARARRGGRS